jgi:hypothetical protein
MEQLYDGLIDEMIAWDVEDVEDAATAGKFPPAQLYCQSPQFKELL